jgi:predicted hydrocarbon binding protein
MPAHADSTAGTAVPGRPFLDDRPRVVHSHDYNATLVRTLLETDGLDSGRILEDAAAELAFETLREEAEGPEVLRAAVELFREGGLGCLDLSGVGPDGGEVVVVGSHFATAWQLRFGHARRPVCAMPAGFIAGALAAAFGGRYEVEECDCAAQASPDCRFRVTPTAGPPLEGPEPLPRAPLSLPATGTPALDEDEIVDALLGAIPAADPEGRILALGGSLTRLWGEYYARVCHRFELEVPGALGAKFVNLPALVLTEAGHSYAFHTFGRLFASEEWNRGVVPLLDSRDDWFHAAVAVINSLGWGTWRVRTLLPDERATVHVFDSYEALGIRRHAGPTTGARCYLARGIVAALMNLLYVGDPSALPPLNAACYNRLFRSPLSFRAVETRCRATDDPFCEIIANPLSPGLRDVLRGR